MGAAVAQMRSKDDDPQELRAQHASLINEAWQRGKRATLAIGQALCTAKEALPRGSFEKMIERDLVFGAQTARMFMRVAKDPRLANHQTSDAIPESPTARDALRRLPDDKFDELAAAGRIHRDMTVEAARELVAEVIPPKPRLLPQPMMRPVYSLVEPADGIARNYGHLVATLKRIRHGKGMSQMEVDHVAEWAEGYCSKLEIPNDPNDGKRACNPSFDTWLGALGVGLRVVAVP